MIACQVTTRCLLNPHCMQANVMYYVRRAMQYIMPGFLPLSPTEAAADSAPIMQLLHKIFQLNSTLLFWVAWLLCPGLQSAYYTLFFTSQAPIKTLYGVLIGKHFYCHYLHVSITHV